MYRPLNPNWFFSYIDIPNLSNITQELTNLKITNVQKVSYNVYYTNVFAKTIHNSCPFLIQYLSNLKILNKFFRLLYSDNMINGSPIHVDSYDPTYCMYSLNIPLSECDNSYTAWFDTNNKTLMQPHVSPTMFATINNGDITKELCRVESNRPLLANTTILHRGITNNPNRSLVGLRFYPELNIDDLHRLGVYNVND